MERYRQRLAQEEFELWGHRVTVFDQNRKRLGYFNGSGITVSDNLSGLGDFGNLVEVTGNPDALDAILKQAGTGRIQNSPAGTALCPPEIHF